MNRKSEFAEAQTSALANEAPRSETLTAYDAEHFTTYMQLLAAAADDASEAEMARMILGVDPARDPMRARKAVRSHIDRANWIVSTGYKELFAS